MSNHARVIAIRSHWDNGNRIDRPGLSLPDGTRVAMPCGLDAQPGNVLAVLTAAEFKLIETYRTNTKGIKQ